LKYRREKGGRSEELEASDYPKGKEEVSSKGEKKFSRQNRREKMEGRMQSPEMKEGRWKGC
jgi:hypothetical protein